MPIVVEAILPEEFDAWLAAVTSSNLSGRGVEDSFDCQPRIRGEDPTKMLDVLLELISSV